MNKDRTMSRPDYAALWTKITARLDQHMSDWRIRIDGLGQVEAVNKSQRGWKWSDSEVLEALMMSILSNSMDWSKIQALASHLKEQMSGYNLVAYSVHTDEELEGLYRWFIHHRSGSMTLRAALSQLREASKILVAHSVATPKEGAIGFFSTALKAVGGDPIDLAIAMGTPGRWKLPGMGVPLASEALRNLGYNIAKPDRHLVRAAAALGMVQFARGPIKEGQWSAPESSPLEQRQTMVEFQSLAAEAGHFTSFVDNAVWLLCAKSGLHLTNDELKRI